jgi:hypothetical protein
MKYEEALAHVNSFTFLAISDAISLVDKIYKDVSITNGDLTALIQRAFTIMEEENFFECKEDGSWHSSLHTDMKKVIDGNPYSGWYAAQTKIIEQQSEKIKSLQAEIEILKNPTCERCDSFAFNMCQHFRSRDCYLYHRGGTVSLFKLREAAES